MLQFVSHCVQQLRHAKGFLESLPCPEEFRHIQKILFLCCAGNRDHRNSRVSSRSMSNPFSSGMTISVMTKSAGLSRYRSAPHDR